MAWLRAIRISLQGFCCSHQRASTVSASRSICSISILLSNMTKNDKRIPIRGHPRRTFCGKASSKSKQVIVVLLKFNIVCCCPLDSADQTNPWLRQGAGRSRHEFKSLVLTNGDGSTPCTFSDSHQSWDLWMFIQKSIKIYQTPRIS